MHLPQGCNTVLSGDGSNLSQGMDRLMENRTVFVIAHRLSTVRNAKAILVLEGGRIIERGSHEELLKQKGRYYRLYTGQAELGREDLLLDDN